MEKLGFLFNHWEAITVVVGGLLVVFRGVATFTETKKDDRIANKLENAWPLAKDFMKRFLNVKK